MDDGRQNKAETPLHQRVPRPQNTKPTKTVTLPSKMQSDGTSIWYHDGKLERGDEWWLGHLGRLIAEDRGLSTISTQHVLDRLPSGYAGFLNPRKGGKTGNAGTVDHWLEGHPGHKYVPSAASFYPHLKHMMAHGSATGCKCQLCVPQPKAPATRRPQPTASAAAPPAIDTAQVEPCRRASSAYPTPITPSTGLNTVSPPVSEAEDDDAFADMSHLTDSCSVSTLLQTLEENGRHADAAAVRRAVLQVEIPLWTQVTSRGQARVSTGSPGGSL